MFDKEVCVRNRNILAAFVAVLLLSVAPLAADTADPMIARGIDVFTTTANGKTFYDFASAPIPAGFFCKKSKPFNGRVYLKGLPLETGAPGQLHGADTVVERLDDAAFDATGRAQTRVRVQALSLVSINPIKTACGDFHAYVTLDGKQRTTTMTIYRTSERGGKFLAPVSVSARMTFVPVNKTRDSRKLVLKGDFSFPAQEAPWAFEGGPGTKRIGSVMVDTDGDLVADTHFAGTSNFSAGWSPDFIPRKGCTLCEPSYCHEDDPTKTHCTGEVWACYPYNCP
jgi:hypothetical protein